MSQSSQISSGKVHFFADIFELNSQDKTTKYALYVKNGTVIFVKRFEHTVLATFPLRAFSEDEYALTIRKCRQILNNDETIAVERPRWMFHRTSSSRKYY